MTENRFDTVWSLVPHVSRYQVGIVLLASFNMFTCAMWLVLPIFTHYTPPFECDVDLLCRSGNCSFSPEDLLQHDQRQCTLTDSNGVRCTEFLFDFNGTGSIDDTQMSTLVSSFSLVCDLAWVAPFMISIKGAVGLVGTFLGSICSDAYGRRVALLGGSVLQTLFAVSMSSMPNWWSYAICDCLIYASSQGLYLAATVYVCEILGPSKRHLAMVSAVVYSSGFVFVSLLAWCLPNWNHLVGCLAAITGLFVPICCFLPESPQYLWSVGRVKQSERVLRQFSPDLPAGFMSCVRKSEPEKETTEKKESWRVILTSKLFLRTFFSVIVLCMASSTIYYGLAFQAATLPGSVYVNNAVNGFVDILGFSLMTIMMKHFPRRRIIVLTFCWVILCSIGCGLLFYYDTPVLVNAGRWVSFACKFFISAVYGLFFLLLRDFYLQDIKDLGMFSYTEE